MRLSEQNRLVRDAAMCVSDEVTTRQAALNVLIVHPKERAEFDRPIAEFQAV